jgi:hypothetical protein
VGQLGFDRSYARCGSHPDKAAHGIPKRLGLPARASLISWWADLSGDTDP